MGNGHMGTPVDRQTHACENIYLPATSLAAVKKE